MDYVSVRCVWLGVAYVLSHWVVSVDDAHKPSMDADESEDAHASDDEASEDGVASAEDEDHDERIVPATHTKHICTWRDHAWRCTVSVAHAIKKATPSPLVTALAVCGTSHCVQRITETKYRERCVDEIKDDVHKISAVACKLAYDEYSGREGLLQIMKDAGFMHVPDLGDEGGRWQVWSNGRSRRAIVAFRGTCQLADHRTNARLITGYAGRCSRFLDCGNLAQTVFDLFGEENVVFAGHSLGGAEALHCVTETSCAVVFSPAVLKEGIRKDYKKRATAYYVAGDLISTFVPISNVEFWLLPRATDRYSHSMDHMVLAAGFEVSV